MLLVTAFWIFLGLALVLLYAPALMIRGGNARILAACLFCIGIIQAQLLANVLSFSSPLPSAILLYAHEFALYAVAPLLFGYMQSLLGRNLTVKQWRLHLSPLLLVVLLVALQVLKPALQNTLEQITYGVSFLAGAVYAYCLKLALRHLSQPKSVMALEASLLIAATLIGVLVAGLMLVGALLDQQVFVMAYGSAITALLVMGHFVYFFYPSIDQVLADELQDALASQPDTTAEAPRKTQLNAVNVEQTIADIETLMQHQQLYQRLDLTLPLLADQLGITPHQLSELINTKLGINFPRLLKNYRITEARRLLLDKPEQSVLEIGLAVGFASLSAFYAAFREVDGMAPGQFRKLHAKT